jgi:hypothetical protein
MRRFQRRLAQLPSVSRQSLRHQTQNRRKTATITRVRQYDHQESQTNKTGPAAFKALKEKYNVLLADSECKLSLIMELALTITSIPKGSQASNGAYWTNAQGKSEITK